MNDITARVEADEPYHARRGAPHEKIGDTRFIAQLEQLRILKQFLFEEKVISLHEKNGSKDDQLNSHRSRRPEQYVICEKWT